MRKVILSMKMSVDGFFEGPDHNIDWHVIDEEMHTFVLEQQRGFGMYLFGRRMYENMSAFWSTADGDPSASRFVLEYAQIYRQMPKLVFSRTLKQVAGNSRLAGSDIAAEVARLKEQPGKDLNVSGANLAAAFTRLGLIDEYRVFISPVILGAGTPLFPAGDERVNLRLVESRTFHSGVVFLRYRKV